MTDVVVEGARPHAKSENEPGCKPKVDVLMAKVVAADSAYLIRLREDWDTRITYYVKRFADFTALDEKLKKSGVFQNIPELPASGSRFGIRRQLSKLGVNKFLDRQHEGLQQYAEAICSQIPNMSADSNLQAFFDENMIAPADDVLRKQMIVEVKSGTTMTSIKGYWKVTGSDRIWSIDEKGRALLDGKHRGENYDIQEGGSGLEYTLGRLDGWNIDIDKSSKDHLVWHCLGEDDLEWHREQETVAETTLAAIADARRNSANRASTAGVVSVGLGLRGNPDEAGKAPASPGAGSPGASSPDAGSKSPASNAKSPAAAGTK